MPVYGRCECGCGREGELRLGKWALACHSRWLVHGRPETGPPPAQRPDPAPALDAAHAAWARRGADTTRMVGDLWEQGLTYAQIVIKTGLSRRVVATHIKRHKHKEEEA